MVVNDVSANADGSWIRLDDVLGLAWMCLCGAGLRYFYEVFGFRVESSENPGGKDACAAKNKWV